MFNSNNAINFLQKTGYSWHSLPFDIDELVKGMNIELEHGSINPITNVTNNNLIMTGKIALAHLLEDPSYYTKLEVMEGGYTHERLLEEKPYPSSYTDDVKEQIKLVSFSPHDKIIPFGSYIYRIQRWAGDIDALETYEEPDRETLIYSFVRHFKHTIKQILKKRLHYITDIKAGVDKRFEIDIGNLENNLFTPNLINIQRGLSIMKKLEILKDEQLREVKQILSKNEKNGYDYDKIYNLFREYYVIRWEPKEILKGYKLLPGKKKILLEDAITHKTHVKIDMITIINGRFVEVTNFLFLVYDRPGEDPYILNFDEPYNKDFFRNRTSQLPTEVEKLFYSEYYKNYFKGLKRMWSIARTNKDFRMIDTLKSFVSGNISSLYQIRSELEAIILIMQKSKFPLTTIRNAIQNMKMSLTYVLEFDEEQLLKLNRQLDEITNYGNKDYMIEKMERVSKYFKQKINYYTMKFMTHHHIFPVPDKYLPKEYKYRYSKYYVKPITKQNDSELQKCSDKLINIRKILNNSSNIDEDSYSSVSEFIPNQYTLNDEDLETVEGLDLDFESNDESESNNESESNDEPNNSNSLTDLDVSMDSSIIVPEKIDYKTEGLEIIDNLVALSKNITNNYDYFVNKYGIHIVGDTLILIEDIFEKIPNRDAITFDIYNKLKKLQRMFQKEIDLL